MSYEDTLSYLYNRLPVFQQVGTSAYKPGLSTSITLDNYLGNPHKAYRTIHVGGTNGKGSTSHLLAAILQESGYRIGLYTSPHLIDFRERIRVNGRMIPKEYVVDFVEKHRTTFEPLHPSFFELTSSMAFDYFRAEKVDFAIIEVGLGGRLDSTNIIMPTLSIITNISYDHMQFLGNTLEEIAFEKAGIIKPDVPVVIGESGNRSLKSIFKWKAMEVTAPIYFAEEENVLLEAVERPGGEWLYQSTDFGELIGELRGLAQKYNTATVLTAIRELARQRIKITHEAVHTAFSHVTELTGLMGRWQCVQESPTVICDTGHNAGGWNYIATQLANQQKHFDKLRMVVGMVNDKDISSVLALMPKDADYYFTQASIPRAMPADKFATVAEKHGLHGTIYPTVSEAVKAALTDSATNDLVFIGGSSFIVADALPLFNQ